MFIYSCYTKIRKCKKYVTCNSLRTRRDQDANQLSLGFIYLYVFLVCDSVFRIFCCYVFLFFLLFFLCFCCVFVVFMVWWGMVGVWWGDHTVCFLFFMVFCLFLWLFCWTLFIVFVFLLVVCFFIYILCTWWGMMGSPYRWLHVFLNRIAIFIIIIIILFKNILYIIYIIEHCSCGMFTVWSFVEWVCFVWVFFSFAI